MTLIGVAKQGLFWFLAAATTFPLAVVTWQCYLFITAPLLLEGQTVNWESAWHSPIFGLFAPWAFITICLMGLYRYVSQRYMRRYFGQAPRGHVRKTVAGALLIAGGVSLASWVPMVFWIVQVDEGIWPTNPYMHSDQEIQAAYNYAALWTIPIWLAIVATSTAIGAVIARSAPMLFPSIWNSPGSDDQRYVTTTLNS